VSKQPWQEPVGPSLRDRLAEAIHRSVSPTAPFAQCAAFDMDYQNADRILPFVRAEIGHEIHAERERISAAIRSEAERALRDGLEVVPKALDYAADIALEPEALNHA
jgi:hypothetical protein